MSTSKSDYNLNSTSDFERAKIVFVGSEDDEPEDDAQDQFQSDESFMKHEKQEENEQIDEQQVLRENAFSSNSSPPSILINPTTEKDDSTMHTRSKRARYSN